MFDQWFGGDQTLESFGEDIAAFGEDMGYYYSQISNADPNKLSGVITQVWALVDLAKGVQDLDKNAFANFSSSLTTLANTGISGFTDAFDNCAETVWNSVVGMLNVVSDTISANQNIANPEMEMLVISMAGVLTEKTTIMDTAVVTMMVGFAAAVKENGDTVVVAMGVVLTETISAINDTKSGVYDSGSECRPGLCQRHSLENEQRQFGGPQPWSGCAERREEGPGQPFSFPGVYLFGREYFSGATVQGLDLGTGE